MALVTKGVVQQHRETNANSLASWHDCSFADLADNPLYQQTIRNVLSDKAFANYGAGQAEREAYQQRAMREVALESLDLHLLLTQPQRKQLEASAEKSLPPSDGESSIGSMIAWFVGQLDQPSLGDWQRKTCDDITGQYAPVHGQPGGDGAQ